MGMMTTLLAATTAFHIITCTPTESGLSAWPGLPLRYLGMTASESERYASGIDPTLDTLYEDGWRLVEVVTYRSQAQKLVSLLYLERAVQEKQR